MYNITFTIFAVMAIGLALTSSYVGLTEIILVVFALGMIAQMYSLSKPLIAFVIFLFLCYGFYIAYTVPYSTETLILILITAAGFIDNGKKKSNKNSPTLH